MAFSLMSVTDLPGGQQVETHPSLSITYVVETIAGGASANIVQQGATSDDWLIAVRPYVSWQLYVPHGVPSNGATLRIMLSSDPAAAPFEAFGLYPLLLRSESYMSNLFLPSVAARFQLINTDPANLVAIYGHIRIQAGC